MGSEAGAPVSIRPPLVSEVVNPRDAASFTLKDANLSAFFTSKKVVETLTTKPLDKLTNAELVILVLMTTKENYFVNSAPNPFLFVPKNESSATSLQTELKEGIALSKSLTADNVALGKKFGAVFTINPNGNLTKEAGYDAAVVYLARPNALAYFIMRECTGVETVQAVEAFLRDLNIDEKKDEMLRILGSYIDWSSLSSNVCKKLLLCLSERSGLSISSVITHAVLLQPMNHENSPRSYLPNIIFDYINDMGIDSERLLLFLSIHGYSQVTSADIICRAASYFALYKPDGDIAKDAMKWHKNQMEYKSNKFIVECKFSEGWVLYVSSESPTVLSYLWGNKLQTDTNQKLPDIIGTMNDVGASICAVRFVQDNCTACPYTCFGDTHTYHDDTTTELRHLLEKSDGPLFEDLTSQMAYEYITGLGVLNQALNAKNLKQQYTRCSLHTLLNMQFGDYTWPTILDILVKQQNEMSKRIESLNPSVTRLYFLLWLRMKSQKTLESSPPTLLNLLSLFK